MNNYNIGFFEKDHQGKLISVDQGYLKHLGKNIADVVGKMEVDICELKPFHKQYSIGERESILLKGTSIQRELFYFNESGPEPIITTRAFIKHAPYIIRGFFFKLSKSPVSWDGKYLTIHNYIKPAKLSLLKFYVLTLKCRGLSNLEIAKRIYRAESTVRNIIQDLHIIFEIYDIITLSRYFDLGHWLNKLTIELLSEKFGTNLQ
ncbi:MULTISPECIES: response regulator transcription factor [Cysteiniphilum]|uniref:response regulator transcription factor n=1 Tax=Cysteiniphilum TaxID=2056696 RepID=UPI00177CEE5D|nr:MULTISPECIES: response regulator transcription factor [Cysteiniphilum]